MIPSVRILKISINVTLSTVRNWHNLVTFINLRWNSPPLFFYLRGPWCKISLSYLNQFRTREICTPNNETLLALKYCGSDFLRNEKMQKKCNFCIWIPANSWCNFAVNRHPNSELQHILTNSKSKFLQTMLIQAWWGKITQGTLPIPFWNRLQFLQANRTVLYWKSMDWLSKKYRG